MNWTPRAVYYSMAGGVSVLGLASEFVHRPPLAVNGWHWWKLSYFTVWSNIALAAWSWRQFASYAAGNQGGSCPLKCDAPATRDASATCGGTTTRGAGGGGGGGGLCSGGKDGVLRAGAVGGAESQRQHWERSLCTAVLLSLSLTGAVWWLVLRPHIPAAWWTPLFWWQAHAMHTFAPLLALVDWCVVTPRGGLRFRKSIASVLSLPVGYLVWSFSRAHLGAPFFWPGDTRPRRHRYGFLESAEDLVIVIWPAWHRFLSRVFGIRTPAVASNLLLLTTALLLLFSLLVHLDGRLAHRQGRHQLTQPEKAAGPTNEGPNECYGCYGCNPTAQTTSNKKKVGQHQPANEVGDEDDNNNDGNDGNAGNDDGDGPKHRKEQRDRKGSSSAKFAADENSECAIEGQEARARAGGATMN